MIVKQHILTVSNNKCSLNRPIAIFNGDDKICIELEIKTPELFSTSLSHHDLDNIFFAFDAYLRLEDGRVIRLLANRCRDNVVRILLTKDFLATLTEPGKAEMQIILKSADNARMTLPIFPVTIGEPIFIEGETSVENHNGRLQTNIVQIVRTTTPSNGVLSVNPKVPFQQATINGNVQIQIPIAPVVQDTIRLSLTVNGNPTITYDKNIYFGAFPQNFTEGNYEMEFFHEGDNVYTGVVRKFEIQ